MSSANPPLEPDLFRDLPRPFYADGSSALFRGDVLHLLPRLPAGCVDSVVADPPYCSGGNLTAQRGADPVTKYCHDDDAKGRPTFSGDTRDQRSLFAWSTLWMSHALRVTTVGGYLVCFADWRGVPVMSDAIQAAGWQWRGVSVWDKGRGARAPHTGYFRHQCEFMLWATNGVCRPRPGATPFEGCYRITHRRADKHHITGKPTPLLRGLVGTAGPGGLVLDPFAGSGTTGVAAAVEGCRFIGFEQSPEYAEITARRLSEAGTREGRRKILDIAA